MATFTTHSSCVQCHTSRRDELYYDSFKQPCQCNPTLDRAMPKQPFSIALRDGGQQRVWSLPILPPLDQGAHNIWELSHLKYAESHQSNIQRPRHYYHLNNDAIPSYEYVTSAIHTPIQQVYTSQPAIFDITDILAPIVLVDKDPCHFLTQSMAWKDFIKITDN